MGYSKPLYFNIPSYSLFSILAHSLSHHDSHQVSKFFISTMQNLLMVTQEAGKPQNSMRIDYTSNGISSSLLRARLFDLAVSLLPGLNFKELELLFVAVKHALKDVEGLIQKKAYKVLSVTLKNSDGFLSAKLEEFFLLMIEVLPSRHFSAKRHRLDCLYSLIAHVAKDDSEQRRHVIISSFLTEIILALKEMKQRKEKKLRAKSEARSLLSKATTSRLSRWNDTEIFSDFGDEEAEGSDAEYMDASTMTGRRSKGSLQLKAKTFSSRSKIRAAKGVPEHLFDQLEDEPLDLLDRQKTLLALRSSKHFKRKVDLDEPEVDCEGRLIIREEEEPKKETPSDTAIDAKSEAASHLSEQSSRNQKRRKNVRFWWTGLHW